MPDRYASAVRARRAELRELHLRLTGSHRGELRSCLALSRLTAAGDAAAALAVLRREAAEHAGRGDRHAREQLPARLAAAVAGVALTVAGSWAAAVRPPLRRIATERGLALEPGWPRVPVPRLPALPPPVELPGPPPLLPGLLDGAAVWRSALFPLAALPLLGLPALGGPAFAPLAVGCGTVGVLAAGRARRTAAERARLHRRVDQVVRAAAAAIDADLERRLVELERTAGPALDAAVQRRRAAVEHELARLGARRGVEP